MLTTTDKPEQHQIGKLSAFFSIDFHLILIKSSTQIEITSKKNEDLNIADLFYYNDFILYS